MSVGPMARAVVARMTALEIRVPLSLREFSAGASAVRVESTTVGGALRAWATPESLLARRLFANDGRIRESIALFLNGQQLDGAARSDTPIREGDRLEIVATIAGG